MSSAGPFTLGFGKHKGEPIDRVPLPYLMWLREQDNLYPATRAAVEAELARRDAPAAAATKAQTGAAVQTTLPTSGDVEPLPTHLQPDAVVRCPHCQRDLALVIQATLR